MSPSLVTQEPQEFKGQADHQQPLQGTTGGWELKLEVVSSWGPGRAGTRDKRKETETGERGGDMKATQR